MRIRSYKVSVKGQATFTWIKTAQSWNETFTYSLDFDDELKVTDYQVWVDSGAAYLARLAQLDDPMVCLYMRVHWNNY